MLQCSRRKFPSVGLAQFADHLVEVGPALPAAYRLGLAGLLTADPPVGGTGSMRFVQYRPFKRYNVVSTDRDRDTLALRAKLRLVAVSISAILCA